MKTIVEKIWDSHVVSQQPGAPTLLYIDLHMTHEVTSPQAFTDLRERGLKVRRPDLTIATMDHSTPTTSRDLPIGIIASLIICTILYVIVGAVFAGLIPYPELIQRLANEQAEPLTMALQNAAPPGVTWPATVVAFGSVIAHTAVLLVFQMGQPRIFFSMARDGLLPPVFAKVHPCSPPRGPDGYPGR